MNRVRIFCKPLFKSQATSPWSVQSLGNTKSQWLQCLRGFKRAADTENAAIRSNFSLIGRPLAFMVTGCTVSFAGATVWQYENLRKRANQFRIDSHEYQQNFGKLGGFRNQINRWWNNMTPGKKNVTVLIALNAAVFVLWRFPLPMMQKFFMSSPYTGAPCWSMLFSMFSHTALLHVCVNMFVLRSFGDVATQLFGREQFLAVYLSAGLIAGFSSHLLKILKKNGIRSLGASGAIIGLLGAVCTAYPDSRLSLAFIDQIFPHSFSAQSGMIALIAFDVMGIVLRWQMFDHAAHLGGMIFGILYVKFGNKLVWGNREPLMKYWHKVRGKT